MFGSKTADRALELGQRLEREMHVIGAQQSQHEAVCGERWKEAKAAMEGVVSAVKSIWWLILSCAGVLICGMAALISAIELAKH